MKMIRVHMTVWVVLLAAGFLLGFVPEYLKNRDLRGRLEEPQKAIDALNSQLQMADLRDAASLMLLELSRQNYGLARDHAAEYYSKLNESINAAQDPAVKKSLQELAMTRDALTSSLAVANPGSLAASQPIVSKTFEVTKSLK